MPIHTILTKSYCGVGYESPISNALVPFKNKIFYHNHFSSTALRARSLRATHIFATKSQIATKALLGSKSHINTGTAKCGTLCKASKCAQVASKLSMKGCIKGAVRGAAKGGIVGAGAGCAWGELKGAYTGAKLCKAGWHNG